MSLRGNFLRKSSILKQFYSSDSDKEGKSVSFDIEKCKGENTEDATSIIVEMKLDEDGKSGRVEMREEIDAGPPALSEQVVSLEGVSKKNLEYKNPEFFLYHRYSYNQAIVELMKFRLPQTSNKTPLKK
ncbi:unnamed protein product [Brassicogethes aeneus]|uniref:NADH dehydrogenase [ubiquinone] flavoprotein 3, mitochondrial n=1 Tax=Brassicogethes aeneus TaxID=1431903 RepID=A0A9P0AQH6_BRAAE|nr:unnamed protein product [Brassicogethes aeneus]